MLSTVMLLSAVTVYAKEEQDAQVKEERDKVVAKIDDVQYDSLEKAFADVKEGQTIELLSDVTITQTSASAPFAALEISADRVTLQGNGNTITATYAADAHVLGTENCDGIEIKDLTIVNEGGAKNGINVYESQDVILEDVTVKNAKNVGIVVNASEVTARGKISLSGNGWGDGINVGWGSNVKDEIEKSSFTAAAGADLSEVMAVYIDTSDRNHAAEDGAGKEFLIDLSQLSSKFVKLEDPTELGAKDTVYLRKDLAAAKVETNDTQTYYYSFSKAIMENNAVGATVTLLKDVENGDGVTIPSGSNVEIDFGGHTYTVTKNLAGSQGTENQCFQLLSDSKITMKNGAIVANNSQIKYILQNYSDLTLEDMKLDGTKGTNSLTIVLSNNSGDTVVKGDTDIIAKSVSKYAFDVYYWVDGGYANGVSVTIDPSMTGTVKGMILYGSDGTESGKEQIAENAKLNIHAGEYEGSFYTYDLGEDKIASISITGGTFSQSVREYVEDSYYERSAEGRYSYYATQEAVKAAAKAGDSYIQIRDIGKDSTTVIFRDEEAVHKTYHLFAGSVLLLPTPPEKSGYVFQGWSDAESVLHSAGEEMTVASLEEAQEIIYTASWKKKSNGGSSSTSSGGSSSSDATTDKTENADGSTTTTVTKPDGTVTEKTENKDGSTVEVVTETDGTVTTTQTDQDGNKTETITAQDGTVSTTMEKTDGSKSKTTIDQNGVLKAEVSLSAQAAAQNGATELPMPSVSAGADRTKAPVVTVEVQNNVKTEIEIPVNHMNIGTVAVLVHADGTESVIKASQMGEKGIVITVEGSATVKIVDNSKVFQDVPDAYWGSNAVQFAASRELFSGTGEQMFQPDAPMTRAMVWTVLAQLDGVTGGGENWYDAGRQWAMENGISDGTNLSAEVTREQLAVMLYQYAKLCGYQTDVKGNLEQYTDASSVSGCAMEAMRWANGAGVINGTSADTLGAQESSTRAQVAAMLMNFCNNIVQ